MGKEIFFTNEADILEYRQIIRTNLNQSFENLKNVFENDDVVSAFDACKYDKVVVDPLTGNNENLIEMLNQYQTYLVTLKAVEFLLKEYPSKSFVARFGNIPGYDIESTDGKIIAECFAAVNYKNNRKLDNDLKKLDLLKDKAVCYEFFHDRVFESKENILYKMKYPGINILKFENLM